MSYLGVLFLLSALIIVHEAGHLAAARLAGIPVAGFAVGFGPRVWSRRWGGVEYSLRAFPLGGFVAPALDEGDFRAVSLPRRLAFFLGGPLANLASALPLLAALNWIRDGASLQGLFLAPWLQLADACKLTLQALAALPGDPGSISGVIGIVAQGGTMAAQMGGTAVVGIFLRLAISLGVSLALLNLLPVPLLDGGQMVMACLEEALPASARLRVPLTLLGLALLAGLLLYANGHDVVRIWFA
jgi:regulator of sigma E protease